MTARQASLEANSHQRPIKTPQQFLGADNKAFIQQIYKQLRRKKSEKSHEMLEKNTKKKKCTKKNSAGDIYIYSSYSQMDFPRSGGPWSLILFINSFTRAANGGPALHFSSVWFGSDRIGFGGRPPATRACHVVKNSQCRAVDSALSRLGDFPKKWKRHFSWALVFTQVARSLGGSLACSQNICASDCNYSRHFPSNMQHMLGCRPTLGVGQCACAPFQQISMHTNEK